MRVVVMGAGGVGGYYGALLARAGHDVTFIARGAHLEALRGRGVRVESAVEPSFTVPIKAAPTAEPGATADLVLFTVKSKDTAGAIPVIADAVGDDTLVLTLQNGVDAGDILAGHFGDRRVLDGVVYLETSVREPGVIAQRGGPRRMIFGVRDPQTEERALALLDVVREAGWLAEFSPYVKRDLWSKLCFIGPFAAMNTITCLPPHSLADDSLAAGMLRRAMAEYVAVANAEGADLPPDAVDRAMQAFRSFPQDGASSMLRDRLAGRPLEADTVVGTVVRRGGARHVPTPVTEMLASLLSPMQSGSAQPPCQHT